MTRCVIIEDELPAADRLRKMLVSIDPGIEVSAICDSVCSAVDYLGSNTEPDFLLMDIQLGDGISFEIFDHVDVQCPVIFTTAFDEYAIRAFKVNSIDYLLKPIDKTELTAALAKLQAQGRKDAAVSHNVVAQVMNMLAGNYRERFVSKVGDKLHVILVADIAGFVSLDKSTYAYISNGKMASIDYTLDQIERMLDPNKFFRISRKHIVNIDAIKDVILYSSSRLKIRLAEVDDNEVLVSREKCTKFKEWLNR